VGKRGDEEGKWAVGSLERRVGVGGWGEGMREETRRGGGGRGGTDQEGGGKGRERGGKGRGGGAEDI